MFRNYLAAALRSLIRNKLYTAINIAGLAVGFATALLISIYVLDEVSYDTWIPGHKNTYLLATTQHMPDGSVDHWPVSDHEFAPELKDEFPYIREIARLVPVLNGQSLRHGDVEGRDMLFWADPDIFAVLPMSVVTGDLATALEPPDGIVITRGTARKYFGRDNPIGETIEIGRKYPMRVTAVIENLPSNSHLRVDAIASGHASFSPFATWTPNADGLMSDVLTYVHLDTPAQVKKLRRALPDLVARHKNADLAKVLTLDLVPLTEVHVNPSTLSIPLGGGMSPSASMATIYAFCPVGLLIAGVAVINFVNLTTARASRRAIEIGIRKVSGAQRRDLIFQFIGEALLYVVLAMLLAIVLAQTLLPALNRFLGHTIPSPFAQTPIPFIAVTTTAMVLALFAGFYPALVLSAFRPVAVLRSAKNDGPRIPCFRRALVVLQFAVLIGLMLVAAIVYQQTMLATKESMRIESDQVLIVTSSSPGHSAICASAFKDAVAALPGVRAVECSSAGSLGFFTYASTVRLRDGTTFALGNAAADYGFFSFYGVKPIVGRVFRADRGDMDATQNSDVVPAVLNETAALKLGFSSPKNALGQVVAMETPYSGKGAKQIEIVGVVPDIPLDVHFPTGAVAYFMAPKHFDMVNVRLAGHEIPETLQAIDRLWKLYGEPIPTPRFFLDDYIEARTHDITQQAQLFTMFTAIAMLIAAMGMFGLATFIAERRTKEIGVRKAMGATRADILRQVVWEFAKPVLWANLIAWPVAGYLMRRWLEGFAYHIELEPWIFIAASALALMIAVITVIGHAFRVIRTTPATALRYE